MSQGTGRVPELDELIDGTLRPSELNFRPYNRLIAKAVSDLPARLPALSDDQLTNILENLDQYRSYLEELRVPDGWARRKLLRFAVEGAVFVGGAVGTTAVAGPAGIIGWVAMGGGATLLAYDFGDITYRHSIQKRIRLTLEDINEIVAMIQ